MVGVFLRRRPLMIFMLGGAQTGISVITARLNLLSVV